MRALLIGMAVMAGAAIGACGDDDGTTSCGAGTHEENGTCVPDTTNPTGADTTSSPQDTTTNPSTTGTGSTPDTSTPTDTGTPFDGNGECTPGEAGQGVVGSPCTKDCQCDQDFEGDPLFCYSGVYMPGFNFCTRYHAAGSVPASVSRIEYNSNCFDATDIKREDWPTNLYLPACEDITDCAQIGAQYNGCGTSGMACGDDVWAESSNFTACPDWSSASGGYYSTQTLAAKKVCIIKELPPFDCSYVPNE